MKRKEWIELMDELVSGLNFKSDYYNKKYDYVCDVIEYYESNNSPIRKKMLKEYTKLFKPRGVNPREAWFSHLMDDVTPSSQYARMTSLILFKEICLQNKFYKELV